MKFKKVFSVLALASVLSFTACRKKDKEEVDPGTHTLDSYVSVSPSNWNELTYQDSNDTVIMGKIGGSFFDFDFEFDGNGKIVPGGFQIKYGALTGAADITADLAAEGKFGLDPAKNTKNRAFKFTLRNDLKWDDGTPIKAADFVYTMKQQLDPAYQNYRADSYYVGSTVIHNAENYVKQGQTSEFDNKQTRAIAGVDDLTKGADGVYQYNGKRVQFAFNVPCAYLGGKKVASYKAYLNEEAYNALAALADDSGYVDITDETIALWGQMISTEEWEETPEYWILYVLYDKDLPVMDFSEVGLYAEGDYDLVIVLDNDLELFDDAGNLTYHAAYEFGGLPLVKQSLFETCRVAADPLTEGALPTLKYNSSVETSASWGPYKLTKFVPDKEFVLERNPNWYGYNKAENNGLYQTDRIVYQVIAEQNTAWQMFLKGELDSIGISPAIGNVEYKTSSRAIFTPDDYIASMQLQSNAEALAGRETDGKDKEILTYIEFRKALSLAINREDYTQRVTTSSKPGLGLFNSMHYYDVANAVVYRDTPYAKKTICDVYGVDYDDSNLDAQYKTVTGYDPNQAKQLFNTAYEKAIADGKMVEDDVVLLTFGTSVINESTRLQFDTLSSMIKDAVKGTSLEGKIETELKDFGDAWANDFRAGAYDICTGGWSGAAWNPGYFLLAYLSPSYMYSRSWDTSAQIMKFKPAGAEAELEMSLMQWYNCLNGVAGALDDFSAGKVSDEFRISIIAALEKEILSVYYTVPLYNYYSAALLYNKVDYITDEYNTFMGYGGLKYLKYNYTDKQWDAVKANQDYKK